MHTTECQAQIDSRAKAIATWKAQRPDHCEECMGVGGTVTRYDPSPAGVGLSPGWMTDFEPCELCVMNSCCPRCGEHGLSDEDDGDKTTGAGPCWNCGWNYNDACPAEPECCCWPEFEVPS